MDNWLSEIRRGALLPGSIRRTGNDREWFRLFRVSVPPATGVAASIAGLGELRCRFGFGRIVMRHSFGYQPPGRQGRANIPAW
jgi:hypothetical protein